MIGTFQSFLVSNYLPSRKLFASTQINVQLRKLEHLALTFCVQITNL